MLLTVLDDALSDVSWIKRHRNVRTTALGSRGTIHVLHHVSIVYKRLRVRRISMKALTERRCRTSQATVRRGELVDPAAVPPSFYKQASRIGRRGYLRVTCGLPSKQGRQTCDSALPQSALSTFIFLGSLIQTREKVSRHG